jgi:hypothetical protein
MKTQRLILIGLLWVGSGLVPGGCSRAEADESTGSVSGSCSLTGTWSGKVPAGPMAGQTNLWKIQADGTTLATIGSTIINGTCSVTGNTATLKDTSSKPAYIACPAKVEGTYTLSFSADCRTVTFSKSSEPCPGREVAVDGYSGTRKATAREQRVEP